LNFDCHLDALIFLKTFIDKVDKVDHGFGLVIQIPTHLKRNKTKIVKMWLLNFMDGKKIQFFGIEI
jgi:hypothetical protein